jgi:hypothetical protein
VLLPGLAPAFVNRLRPGPFAPPVGDGIRLGHLHRRQPAVQDRDRAAADRHPLEEFNYAAATAIAAIMLVISFVQLLGHQPAPVMEPQALWLTRHQPPSPSRGRDLADPASSRSRVVPVWRPPSSSWPFSCCLPLIIVFEQAFSRGPAKVWETLAEPDTRSAIG